MDDAKTIKFDPAAPAISIKASEYTGCKCMAVELDETRRVIECTACGKIYEPFDWVLGIARKERNLVHRSNQINQEIARRKQSLQNIKRDERNARSRLRRLAS